MGLRPVLKTPRLGIFMEREVDMDRRKYTREFRLEAVS
jgi:hypothetical protein